MSVEIITAGVYSTIQDDGRFGYRNQGVPVSGFMDSISANLANSMLNNPSGSAVIESTILGPSLRFGQNTYIVICGAKCDAKLNQQSVTCNTVTKVEAGDVLSMGRIYNGRWTYLAVADGFKTEKVLGSRSYYKGVTKNDRLQRGFTIKLSDCSRVINNRAHIQPMKSEKANLIDVYEGPDFVMLDEVGRKALFAGSFKISDLCNRMAYKLQTYTKMMAPEIITSAVQPGTIQMTPAGELIVLMKDCQTTGGYSRILQLNESSINRLAQMTESQEIFFRLIG